MYIVDATGVVSGEFGLADAAAQKKKEIEPWIEDEHPKVRAFASYYVGILDRRIPGERRQVEEEIAARKHLYGTEE